MEQLEKIAVFLYPFDQFAPRIYEQTKIFAKLLESLKDPKSISMETVQRLSNELSAATITADRGRLAQARQEYEEAYQQLTDGAEEVSQQISAHLHRILEEKGEQMTREDLMPTAEMQEIFNNYQEGVYEVYKRAESKYHRELDALASSGYFGDELKTFFDQLHRAKQDSEDLHTATANMERIVSNMNREKEELIRKITEEYNGDLFRYEEHSLQEIFEGPFENWEQHFTALQQAWTDWRNIWKDRPPVQNTSLY